MVAKTQPSMVLRFLNIAVDRFSGGGSIRKATATWASWEAGKLFPMGVALAGTLILYLALGAAQI